MSPIYNKRNSELRELKSELAKLKMEQIYFPFQRDEEVALFNNEFDFCLKGIDRRSE